MATISVRGPWALVPLCAASIFAAAALIGCGGGSSGTAAATPSSADGISVALAENDPLNPIQILSSEPSLISGGDALVQVALPPGTAASAVKILAGGSDMTTRFKEVTPGSLLGVVSGLPVGTSTIDLVPVSGSGTTASVTVRNWPIQGPIISGPHQTPFFCQTQQFVLPDGSTLGPALDADCSVQTRITYMYRATTGGALKVMPSTSVLPADVGTTTTSSGLTVPFVVRVETGTVDRGIYQSAVLHDPTKESAPTPLAPPKAWNRRLVAVEGFGCPGGWYLQGGAQGNLAIAGFDFSLLNVDRLGEGSAMFANTLQHASNNCNAVLESEAAMMSKEHFIETHGVPDFTVSAGCSGGSYGSAQPADRIPKLFDGVMILCTFPDPLGIAFSGSDGHLLTHVFYATNASAFTDSQIVAITGYKSVKAFTDAANQAGRTDPVPGRVDFTGYVSAVWNAIVPVGLRYDPVTNKTGARPTVYDASKNIYGVDPATGFALRPFDNVGVQYGLEALNAGAIDVNQFILLNSQVGGYDQDANYVLGRTVGDPGAMLRAQQAGLQLGGNGGLASIPVFDISGIYNDDASYHYQWYHFALRDRLVQMNGNADNHVMWRGNPVPADPAWKAFIQWVAAYKADAGPGTQRDKVIRAKPIQDGCWSGPSTFIQERQTLSSTADTACNALFPSWTFPRRVAGGPVAANIMKCDLKPVVASDYKVPVTTQQLAAIKRVFFNGVCDWSKPGNVTGVVPNGSFGPSPERLVFSGP
ncbi:MAG: DUF6351 family protein [Pseudomonadota bacterium]|nr:DUF6351 family protein [Pseudomonadota bacterium]